MESNSVYLLDLVLLVPALWVVVWLFVGTVTWRTVTLTFGAPFCLLGLAWVAAVVLRLTGVIA